MNENIELNEYEQRLDKPYSELEEPFEEEQIKDFLTSFMRWYAEKWLSKPNGRILYFVEFQFNDMDREFIQIEKPMIKNNWKNPYLDLKE